MNKNENVTLSRLAFRLAPKLKTRIIGFTYQGTPISSAKAGSGGPDMEMSVPAWLQHPQGFVQGLRVLTVQNDVVAMQHGLEVFCLVVNQDVRAEAL